MLILFIMNLKKLALNLYLRIFIMKTLKKILFFLLTMENAHVICLKAMSSTPISPTMCLRRRDTNNDRVVQIIQVKEKQQQGQKYLIPSASEARKHLKNGVNPNINN